MLVLDIIVLALMAYVRIRSFRRIRRIERDIALIKRTLNLA
jgi:hypothetical protein